MGNIALKMKLYGKSAILKILHNSDLEISTICFYFTEDSIAPYEPDYMPLDERYFDRSYRYKEADGRRYRILPLHARGATKGSTGQLWKGTLPPSGIHWRYIPEILDEMDTNGLIVVSSNGIPGYKKYLVDSDGIRPGTIWTDIKQLSSGEKVQYDTQNHKSFREE